MTTPLSTISGYIQQCEQIVDTELTRTLARLGEEALIIARDRPMTESWIDHTGNLRSSVGYAIYDNRNEQFRNGFQPTSAPEGNGAEGQTEGQEFLESVTANLDAFNNKLLVVVAGMNYADFVEAIEGKDVLATAETETRKKMPDYLLKTKARIDQLIARL